MELGEGAPGTPPQTLLTAQPAAAALVLPATLGRTGGADIPDFQAMTQASPSQPEASGTDSAVAAAVGASALPLAALQQQHHHQQGPLPLSLPQGQQNGSKALVMLPPQGPGGLPAGAAPGPPDAALLHGLSGSPETGLIAVSSSASLASSGGGAGGDSNKTLYLGNLHPFVTEQTLQEVFAGLGGVTELKVIKDKATGVSAGYGFAKFTDPVSAQAALDKVNKSMLFGQEARVNWAFQKEQREEVANHFHVFVGDLSSDVTDATLHGAFQNCAGCSDARVMWDHATGRSRGYGFVSFRLQEEAEAAIQMMHGQFIGARRVRCGWAQHKTDGIVSMDPQILDRADPTNTNVYVGNLAPQLSDVEVRRHFGTFGPVAEVKLYRKGSYGFVRYKNHQDAVRAIMGMNGQGLGGKVMKCSWGRHPSTPPSGVQTSLMLAAAGLNPLAMGSAGMLGHASTGGHGGMMAGGHGGVMGGHGGVMGGHMGMMAMPMSAGGAQSIIHGGQGMHSMQSIQNGMGMGGAGVVSHSAGGGAAAMLNGGGQGGMLQVDHAQLQHMVGMQHFGVPYGGNGGMHSNMAFFGGGGAGGVN